VFVGAAVKVGRMGSVLVGEASAGVKEWSTEAVLVDWTRGGAEAMPIRQATDMNKIKTNPLAAKNRLVVSIGNRIITWINTIPGGITIPACHLFYG
jgi:hypothetical protein